MKPTRNNFYCAMSHRTKMLFPTQKKADNFIRFNSEAIKAETGFAPIRSYYCITCLGWHVTHREAEVGNSFDARDKFRLNKAIGANEEILADIVSHSNKILDKIECHLLRGRLGSIEDDLFGKYDRLAQRARQYHRKELPGSLRAKKCLFVMESAKAIIGLPIDQRADAIRRLQAEDEEKAFVVQVIVNNTAISCAQEVMAQLREMKKADDVKSFNRLVSACRHYIRKISGTGTSSLKKELNKAMDYILYIKGKEMKEAEAASETPAASVRDDISIINYQGYRLTLLYVIGNIEKLPELYEKGEFGQCEYLVDVSALSLDRLNHFDDNTELLSRQLRYWIGLLADRVA